MIKIFRTIDKVIAYEGFGVAFNHFENTIAVFISISTIVIPIYGALCYGILNEIV